MNDMPSHTGIAKDFGDDGATVIGIAGGTASGTTTLAEGLAGYFGELGYLAITIPLDTFYEPLSNLSPPTQEGVNWDHPKTLDWEWASAAIENLASGSPAAIPQYDFETAERGAIVNRGGGHTYVIVEGLWSLFSMLREHYDVSVYVETPAWVRLCRRVKRDREERGCSCIETVRQFERDCQPMHRDHVRWQQDYAYTIDGNRRPDEVLEDAIDLLDREGVI